MTPEDFFAESPLALEVFARVREALSPAGSSPGSPVGVPVGVRVSKSQVAFRRRRGFAYLWLPEMYLGGRAAGVVVLSIALGRQVDSPRFKEVVHVAPTHWMHHLELRSAAEVDDEVIAWLTEAAARAA